MANCTPFVLRVVIVLIFAVWISLWLLKPTELWTRKWKSAEERATKTLFFSYNGKNLDTTVD